MFIQTRASYLMSKRAFYELLARVGNDGRFQCIVTSTMCLTCFMIPTNGYIGPYLFHESDYKCPSQITNCQQYVCSLQPSQRQAYIPSDSRTMISRFGDYRCVSGGDPETVNIVMYSGGVTCLLAGLLLITCLTQRQILVLWTVICILALAAIILSPSLILTAICLFFVYGSRSIFLNLTSAYLVQFVSQDTRLMSQITLSVFVSLATPLVGLMHYLITPWQLTIALYHILPLTVLLFLLMKFCPQTPREMIVRNQVGKAMVIYEQVASTNGMPCDISLPEVERLRSNYLQSRQNQQNIQVYFWDLFRYASLRMPTIISIILHFLISYQTLGSQLLLNQYAANIYFNGVIIGASALVCSVVCLFTIKKLPRKAVLVVIQTINTFLSGALFIWVPCVAPDSCSSTQQSMQTVGLFVFRLLSCITYYFFYIGQAEFFPAQIRPEGLLLTGIACEVAITLVPVIQTEFEAMKVSVILTFAISAALLALTGLFFPQTLGVTPPEMIQELQESQQQPPVQVQNN